MRRTNRTWRWLQNIDMFFSFVVTELSHLNINCLSTIVCFDYFSIMSKKEILPLRSFCLLWMLIACFLGIKKVTSILPFAPKNESIAQGGNLSRLQMRLIAGERNRLILQEKALHDAVVILPKVCFHDPDQEHYTLSLVQ